MLDHMSATELTEVIILKVDDIWKETNENHEGYQLWYSVRPSHHLPATKRGGRGRGGGVRPAPASLTWGLAGLAVVLSSMLPEAFEALT